jgi:hypothetical protein
MRSRIPIVFVLPGSANFTADTYIHDHERPAMEAHAAVHKGVIVPVAVPDLSG